MMKRSLLLLLYVLALWLPLLAACGKKGDPTLSPGETDTFGRTYPTSTDPQSGVFQ